MRSKASENNRLIRPPAERVPGLDNREIAPISSPHEIGVEHQSTLTSPFGSELVGVIWLTLCSGYVLINPCDCVLFIFTRAVLLRTLPATPLWRHSIAAWSVWRLHRNSARIYMRVLDGINSHFQHSQTTP